MAVSLSGFLDEERIENLEIGWGKKRIKRETIKVWPINGPVIVVARKETENVGIFCSTT